MMMDLAHEVRLPRRRLVWSSLSAVDYLRQVVIDSRPEPRRWGDVAYPWQLDLGARVAPMIEAVAGLRKGYTGPRNFWATLARGHDKTSFIGRLLNWALAYGKTPIKMSAAAADGDQAGLLREAMQAEASLNPWLADRLSFGREFVRGRGGNLRILSADAASAFGRRDDLVVCDELTHWVGERGGKGERLFSALWSGRSKRPGSVFVVISNAGVIDSWQWAAMQEAKKDPARWLVFAPDGRLPTWMRPEDIDALRAMLPPATARRVLDNVWIDPAEASGYLNRAQIVACEDESLAYQPVAPWSREGIAYYAAIDYGPRRDRTALGVVHREPDASRSCGGRSTRCLAGFARLAGGDLAC
jgi:phage terminase large subunit-like protein